MVKYGCAARMDSFMTSFKGALLVNSAVWSGRQQNKFLPIADDPKLDQLFFQKVGKSEDREGATEGLKESAHDLATILGRTRDTYYIEVCFYLNQGRIKIASLSLERQRLVSSMIVKKESDLIQVQVESLCDVGRTEAVIKDAAMCTGKLKAWFSTHFEGGARLCLDTYDGGALLPAILQDAVKMYQGNVDLILSSLRQGLAHLVKVLTTGKPEWEKVDPDKDYSEDQKFIPWLKANVCSSTNALTLSDRIESVRDAVMAVERVHAAANAGEKFPQSTKDEAHQAVKVAQRSLCICAMASFIWLADTSDDDDASTRKVAIYEQIRALECDIPSSWLTRLSNA
jgi:hypothetical protein